ncbi:hypothetical protein SAMN05444141_101539 [Pseudovibrio denitrificans]|uniref:Uncharacterized protein n=1 Tax=Pseudovibrio denitrificans TaxID=258256 RepID=A0A1I6Y048_9HYPH|nr:hypothetical protein [Pseudovibrio denitrificans]SFT43591.1 hypothetical protein SAMN05444141_101539 [Pseudovibrio denitrificans]
MYFAKLSRFIAYVFLAIGALQYASNIFGFSIAETKSFSKLFYRGDANPLPDAGVIHWIGLAIIFGAIWEICSHLKQINDKSN